MATTNQTAKKQTTTTADAAPKLRPLREIWNPVVVQKTIAEVAMNVTLAASVIVIVKSGSTLFSNVTLTVVRELSRSIAQKRVWGKS